MRACGNKQAILRTICVRPAYLSCFFPSFKKRAAKPHKSLVDISNRDDFHESSGVTSIPPGHRNGLSTASFARASSLVGE